MYGPVLTIHTDLYDCIQFDSESITDKEHKLDFDRTEASLLSDFDAATCQ